jgi:hypothetical protein
MMKILLIVMSALSLLSCAANQASADVAPPPSPATTPAPSPKICGGIAGFQCKNDKDYCAYEEGTCKKIADASGTCKPKPEMCPMIYAPVCGCDGQTYSNSCVAASHGVSVAARGKCS